MAAGLCVGSVEMPTLNAETSDEQSHVKRLETVFLEHRQSLGKKASLARKASARNPPTRGISGYVDPPEAFPAMPAANTSFNVADAAGVHFGPDAAPGLYDLLYGTAVMRGSQVVAKHEGDWQVEPQQGPDFGWSWSFDVSGLPAGRYALAGLLIVVKNGETTPLLIKHASASLIIGP
jgi:hypothetical protein